MDKNLTVKIPDAKKGISRKNIKGTAYIYYQHDSVYDPAKGRSKSKCTCIGKAVRDDDSKMYPNRNFFIYFPDEEEAVTDELLERRKCLRAGAFLMIRKVIQDCGLDSILQTIIGEEYGLFLDLAAYEIITENNAGQYYPDYAYDHLLFTDKMKVYSDIKICRFLHSLTRDQSIEFQNIWNERQDHREKIYISYDSTNKNCQAGDIDIVEFGHPKVDQGKAVFNFAIAYDQDNSVPLYYEEYPGSIVDISQLQMMLEKAAAFRYRHIGFILDRGYFSRENIAFMDQKGYSFIMMVKGMKKLVRSLVLRAQGSFEEDRGCSIRDYHVNGITVKEKLYASDEKERYFHIFYDGAKHVAEREALEAKIDRMADYLRRNKGKKDIPEKQFSDYFDLVYYHKGEKDEAFQGAIEKEDVINAEIKTCGYFVIITSDEMTAAKAIEKYKGRDCSEKLFRGDKSYLGNKSMRVQSEEALQAKIFIEFVALIIRNQIYTTLKKQMKKAGKKKNYMTVPAAIRELEKIDIIKYGDGAYKLDHAITACQKEILEAFGLEAETVQKQANQLGRELANL